MASERRNDKALAVTLRQRAPIPLDVNFTCNAGELLAIVGPSGGGKSTILRAIAGLVTPSSGRIECNGKTWLDTETGINLAAHHRSTGFVFQSFALFPHMSARANVEEALPVEASLKERRRIAEELLARVHLAGLEERKPSELSGGQQQRVAVARALAREPNVILLDEPFSAVDEATRKKLQSELLTLRQTLNVPILLVTHSLEEATLLADNICLVHHGKSLQSGPTQTVLNNPASSQAARLIGHRNIFGGEIVAQLPEAQKTMISWAGHRVEADYQPDFTTGSQIMWLVPQSGVILHQRVRPSKGERENPIAGEVIECLKAGDNTRIALCVSGETDPLALSVPTHVAERNSIRIGETIQVSLLAKAIHILPD
ncbi:sulfate/thiosulfate import ATP-binding protein CysA [bacterium MnTg02]|nr:sulfate/thiosulfate import ATP-binding protein CysA [bacterium MnTg02]